jgi:hypothetical protein
MYFMKSATEYWKSAPNGCSCKKKKNVFYENGCSCRKQKNVFYEKRNSDRGVYILETECRLRIRSARFVTPCRTAVECYCLKGTLAFSIVHFLHVEHYAEVH